MDLWVPLGPLGTSWTFRYLLDLWVYLESPLMKPFAKGLKTIGQRPGRPWPKATKPLAEGQSPPQELEVSPRSGLYLLVFNTAGLIGSQAVHFLRFFILNPSLG